MSLTSWAPEARLLLTLTLLWLAFGLLVLFSASVPVGLMQYGDGLRFFNRQVLGALLGLGGLALACRVPLERWFRIALLVFPLLVVLIVLVKVPGIGVELNGARRWFQIGPLSVQPSELVKPFLLLLGSLVLARWPRLPGWWRVLSVTVMGLAIGGVLIQPDLGTAVLLAGVLWCLAFISGFNIFGLLLLVGLGGGVAWWKISTTAYQMNRIQAFMDPWAAPQAEGYQLIQSLLAVGSGGITGSGFGLSLQKASSLPYPYSDFIFAVFAEEFGLVGTLAFVAFLLVFLVAGLRVAIKCADPARRLLAAGATLLLVGQAFLHIGVVAAALPPKGIPLPLVSYGGSGLIASLLCFGLLIRAAREINTGDVLVWLPRRHRARLRPRTSVPPRRVAVHSR